MTEKTIRKKKNVNAVHYIDNKKFLDEIKKHKVKVAAAKEAGKQEPRMNDYLGDCILKIGAKVSTIPKFYGYCLDVETEAMTNRGWMKYDEITTNDFVASIDIAGRTVWSKINDIYIDYYKGKMFNLTHKSLDALVTPNHKFLTKEDGLIPIEYIKSSHHLILHGTEMLSDQTKNYTDSFVELMGWITTDGQLTYYKNTPYITIYQNEGNKAESIRKALSKENLICTEKIYGIGPLVTFRISSKNTEFIDNLKIVMKDKIIEHSFINDISTDQRKILFHTIIAGDGWVTKTGYGFSQKNEKMFDVFQYLVTLLGYAATKKFITQKTKFGTYNGFITRVGNTKNRYSAKFSYIDLHGGKRKVSEGKYKNSGVKGKPTPNHPTKKYAGNIWCLTTDYGNFVVRRNGKIHVTGNSFREEMVSDGIENCILYFDRFDADKYDNPFAYYTQIMIWAFVRRINKEEKNRYIIYKNFEISMMNSGLTDHLTDENDNLTFAPMYDNILVFIARYEFKELKKKFKRSVMKGALKRPAVEELINEIMKVQGVRHPALVQEVVGEITITKKQLAWFEDIMTKHGYKDKYKPKELKP